VIADVSESEPSHDRQCVILDRDAYICESVSHCVTIIQLLQVHDELETKGHVRLDRTDLRRAQGGLASAVAEFKAPRDFARPVEVAQLGYFVTKAEF
jgi:hypothetical protein